jgi:serine/threonine protein kinase
MPRTLRFRALERFFNASSRVRFANGVDRIMPETDVVGSYFGKYFLLKKLAAGGMGEVFLAKQQGPAGFEKILILKKVLPHLTENKEFVELFLGEARLAARMNHRNIVQVFELGEQDGGYFIAMEYVQGKALRDVIDVAIKKKEKLHGELCRSVAEQICDGASYAHNLTDISGRSLNIIHRDLNPQNVLISYTGDVKVIDFGIAKSEMSTVKTEAGMIKGKFVYMSPEQSLAKKLDKRSDIFAIGITLYEMLTGINPFHKNNIVLTLEAVQRFEPPPPSEYDPAFAPFDPIIAKSLAKDRDRRYADAAEMQDDLRRVVLPRAPERLGQFMSRLFRQQLEEDQKLLMDTDSSRLTAAGKGRTPAKPTPAQTPAKAQPSHSTLPESQPPEGATMMLPSAPTRNKPTPARAVAPPAPVAPPRPAPRPPLPAKKPQGAGDTLIDGGGVIAASYSPPAQPDEAPGATMMLKPGQALPTPPPRKAPAKPTDTMPEGAAPEGAGATMFLGTAPARPAAAKKPLPSNGRPSTNIMSAEESAEAQKEALEKMEASKNQVVRTRTRPQSAPAKKKKAGKGMWIAVGLGGLVVLGGIVALLMFLLADDAPAARRKKPVAAAAETAAPADVPAAAPSAEESKPAKAAGNDDDKAAAPKKEASAKKEAAQEKKEEAKKEEAKKEEAKKAAAGKSLGTLTLNPGPNVPVSYAGNTLPKQVGAFNLPVTADRGSIEVGDSSTEFKVTLDYVVSGGVMTFKVNSAPFAIASIDGPSRGRTPIADVKVEKKMTVVELKRPGAENGMTLRLLFRTN